MTEELKKLEGEIKTAFHGFKEVNDRQAEEIKKWGDVSAETKAAIEKANADIDRIEGEIKKVLTRLNRPAAGGDTKGELSEADQLARKAFNTMLRKGTPGPDEAKALSVSEDTAGGYLAPKEYVNDLNKTIVEFSPIRQVATVRQTTARSIQMPKRTGTFAAAWVSEQGTRAETTGLAFGLDEIPNHEMYAMVDVSQQMLEDTAFNVEQFLNDEFAEQFGVLEGAAFVSGNGVGKPEGLLHGTTLSYTAGGHASAITADGLIAILYDLKDAYARMSSWLLKRSTLKAIRQLKDGNDQYIWQPGIAGAAPATILDRPYYEATDMPAIAADAYSVLFGDFKRAYTIVDRVQVTIVRDGVTQANVGNVRFWARKRVGGQVRTTEAARKLKIATS